MEWPDRYLAELPLYGFDAIHCSIYRNPNNAPGPEPYWSDAVIRRHKPGAMKALLRRTARFGLDSMRRFFTSTRARRKTSTVCASWSARSSPSFPRFGDTCC